MLTRNSGKPLSALEQGEVVKRLLAFGWTEAQVARKTGYSQTHIANLLTLSSAPAEVTEMVRKGEVSARLATEVVHKTGDQAAQVLGDALAKARQAGKEKVTAKHLSGNRAEKTSNQVNRMTLTRAYQIVHDCNAVYMATMGLLNFPPPSLKGYSLAEMIEAKGLVRAHEENQPAPKTITCTCDDRLIAALYVACHWEGGDPKDCEAVVVCDGNAVIVLRADMMSEKQNVELP